MEQNQGSKKSIYRGLPTIATSDAINDAKKVIETERSDNQVGLYTRWHNFNHAFRKYARFRQVYMLSGLSGGGKSFFANKIRMDFGSFDDIIYPKEVVNFFNLGKAYGQFSYQSLQGENFNGILYKDANGILLPDGSFIKPGRNRRFHKNCIMIHFGLEMHPVDELMRSVADVMGKSDTYLMSSEYDKENRKFNRISDAERDAIYYVLDSFKNVREYYVPVSGTLDKMDSTVDYFVKLNKGCEVVIFVDHGLLIKAYPGMSEGELVGEIANLVIEWRNHYNAMVWLLWQSNNEIEDNSRITNPVRHYPIKSDIHYGSKIWWASDVVIYIHQPKRLHIERYGRRKLLTHNLIHAAILKARRGIPANAWFIDDLQNGRIIEAKIDDFM